jgi:hypothetical protein
MTINLPYYNIYSTAIANFGDMLERHTPANRRLELARLPIKEKLCDATIILW